MNVSCAVGFLSSVNKRKFDAKKEKKKEMVIKIVCENDDWKFQGHVIENLTFIAMYSSRLSLI